MTVDSNEVRALVDKVKAELPGHTWTSGTITRAVSDAGFASVVELVLDGDATETVIQATNLTAIPMVGGTRVKVVFDPPQGVYVLGVLTQNAVPVARLECSSTLNDSLGVVFGCIRSLAGGMDQSGLSSLIVPLSGIYSTTARVGYTGTGGLISLLAGTDIIDQVEVPTGSGSVLLASAAFPVLASVAIAVQFPLGITPQEVSGTHLAAHYVTAYNQIEDCPDCGGNG